MEDRRKIGGVEFGASETTRYSNQSVDITAVMGGRKGARAGRNLLLHRGRDRSRVERGREGTGSWARSRTDGKNGGGGRPRLSMSGSTVCGGCG